MAFGPERAAGSPAASGVPVKPAEGGDVPPAWLLDEHPDLAASVDRLAADADLVLMLALGGYEGRDWDYFATVLAQYGMAVIGGWTRRNLIFQRCATRGYGGLPTLGRSFTDDEVDELTGETIAKALHHFRVDVLMKGRWDHRRGATLRTFFIGQCLIRFANVYRRWHANEWRNRYDSTDDVESVDRLFNKRVDGPEDAAINWVTATRALRGVRDDRVQQAMILTADGKQQDEIAEILGVSKKAVERMLANERHRLKKREAG